MDVEIKNDSNNKKLRVCDIIQLKNPPFSERDFYIVIKEGDEYIARGLRGCGGANGYHKTIEHLEESLRMYGLVHYSSDEFKIVLERKE